MTKILALDSSTDACSAALTVNGQRYHRFELAAKSHTQRLLPMVDELLQEASCQLDDLDAIAFGRGPGSFTGLRICMGIVQGLAFGANLPVLPVSTLQAMARGYQLTNPDNQLPVLAALDARMGEIYWGLFDTQQQPLAEEQVMAPGLVVTQQAVAALDGFIALGSGWHYPELSPLKPVALHQDAYPDAAAMLDLAISAFARGEAVSILEAQPVYLRDSVSWQKRQRIRTDSLPS